MNIPFPFTGLKEGSTEIAITLTCLVDEEEEGVVQNVGAVTIE
jgi:hypothetical protein